MTCADISIRTFIKIKFSNEWGLLGIENEDEARIVFDRIETEYNDATGFRPGSLQEINKTNALLARVKGVQQCCFAVDEALRLLDGEDLVEIISVASEKMKRYGINIKYDGNIISFQRAYKSIKTREKSNEIRLREAMQKQETNGDVKEYTIDDFYNTVRAIERMQGFTINENETNMRKFAGMVKEYRELVRVQNSKGN